MALSPPVRALVFDMDGTLVDSMPAHAQSWLALMARHGWQRDLADFMRQSTGRNGVECIRILAGRELSAAEAQPYVDEKESLYRELFGRNFQAVAGAQAFVAQAQSLGLKVAVGTAGDVHNLGFALKHLQLARAPDALARGDEGLPGKPEPAIFLKAAERLGIAPEHCVVFEDAPLGIEAARRAGMRAVAICTSHTAEELSGPHLIAAAANFEALGTGFLPNLLA
jgi:beta-phosphoglucomutase-like phosphatase (HAD superfamily)